MHWVTDYLGKPWEPGARGPDAFDCWGLLRDVYERQFGLSLPFYPGLPHDPTASEMSQMVRTIRQELDEDWLEIPEPFEGCAVAMSQSRAYHHVGLFMEADGPRVLHCWDGAAVMLDPLPRLKLKGLKKITYFKHRLWPTSSRPQTRSSP